MQCINSLSVAVGVKNLGGVASVGLDINMAIDGRIHYVTVDCIIFYPVQAIVVYGNLFDGGFFRILGGNDYFGEVFAPG